MLRRFPWSRLPRPPPWWLSPTRASQRCEPMNPAPPVTNTRMCSAPVPQLILPPAGPGGSKTRARVAAVPYAALNVGAFFIVVPGLHQQVGRGVLRAVIFAVDAQHVFKRLATTVGDAPVAAPQGLAVVKAGPHRAHGNLVRMVLLHVAVEIIQVVFAVVAAVARPAVFARLHPGVVSVKRVRISCVLVLVDEQRRIGPGLGHLAHTVPVSSGFFWEDEDHGTAVIAKIGVARRACVGAN